MDEKNSKFIELMVNSNLNIILFGYTSVLGREIIFYLNKKFKKSNFYLFSRNTSKIKEINELNENKFNNISLDLANLENTKKLSLGLKVYAMIRLISLFFAQYLKQICSLKILTNIR